MKQKNIFRIIKIVVLIIAITIGIPILFFAYTLFGVLVIGPTTHKNTQKEFIKELCNNSQKTLEMGKDTFKKSYSLEDLQKFTPRKFCDKNAVYKFETTGVLSDENSVWNLTTEINSNTSIATIMQNQHLFAWKWKILDIEKNIKSVDETGKYVYERHCQNYRNKKFEIPHLDQSYCGISKIEVAKRNYTYQQLNKNRRWQWLTNLFK